MRDYDEFRRRLLLLLQNVYLGREDYDPTFKLPISKKRRTPKSSEMTIALSLARRQLAATAQQHNALPITQYQKYQRFKYYAFKKWISNPNFILVPADKNLGFVMLDTKDYLKEVYRQLNNREYYKEVPASTNAYQVSCGNINSYIAKWMKKDVWTKQQCRYMTYKDERELASFYILPKVHKTPWTGRPIVASVRAPYRRLATLISHYLRQVAKNLPSILRDSKQIIQRLEGWLMDINTYLFSLDAENMYNNLPTIQLLSRMRDLGIEEWVLQGLLLTFQLAFLKLDGTPKVWKQIKGIPMGINYAVDYANIAVYILCESHSRFVALGTRLPFYGRFIDDIVGIWKGSKQDFQEFHKTVKELTGFNWTLGHLGNELIFMDLLLTVNEQRQIKIGIYQKPQNHFLYIPSHSRHPPSNKRAWIRGELIRYRRNCTEESAFNTQRLLFMERLIQRGYQRSFLDGIFVTVAHQDRLKDLRLLQEDMLTPRLIIPGTPSRDPTTSLLHPFWLRIRLAAQNHALQRFGQLQEDPPEDQGDTVYFITEYHKWFHQLDFTQFQATFGPSVIKEERCQGLTPVERLDRWYADRPCSIKICFRAGKHLGDLFTKKSIGKKVEIFTKNSQAVQHTSNLARRNR